MGANLKEVRERIKSVINTQQITKAMKMVSAAKLRRAQQAIVQIRPYSDRLNRMLKNILVNTDADGSSAYGQIRDVNNVLVVLVTSSRGLCGAFNTNILKEAMQHIEANYSDVRAAGKLHIMCIGKKGYDFARKKLGDCHIIRDHMNLFDDLSYDNVARVSGKLMSAFLDGKYDRIDVAYGRFRNAAVQYPEVEAFLPVPKPEVHPDLANNVKANYIFEPDEDALLQSLIPNILQVQFQRFLLDTNASEHGARMTAMDKATENAGELLNDLRLSYNKARQDAITKELSEIVGGAAALGG